MALGHLLYFNSEQLGQGCNMPRNSPVEVGQKMKKSQLFINKFNLQFIRRGEKKQKHNVGEGLIYNDVEKTLWQHLLVSAGNADEAF